MYQPKLDEIVRVLWDDASWWFREVDLDELEDELTDECLTVTYGRVIKLTDKSIFISAEDQVTEESLRGITRIPWSYILRIDVLEPREL